jgi:protein-S-isoprenylcysteine O-methyltransferase Ste14
MKKLIVVAYGLVAYVVFLGAFLYAIAFVGDFLVPKTVDSGTEIDLMTALLINATLLGAFAVQHSVMARPAFKARWVKIVGTAAERSTYVLVSSLVLILLYWKWQPLHATVWSFESDLLVYAMWGAFAFGWLVVFLSTWMINHFELFGLKQIYDHMKDVRSRPPEFRVRWFYRLVRHPIMVGFIIAFWATPHMSLGHLVFSIATTLYIIAAVAGLEERDLRKAIGQPYEDYRKKVPMFVPFTK